MIAKANRKTQNEKTLHADLLLAGIAQLVTVIVADKIHQHQYIRSLKPLIATKLTPCPFDHSSQIKRGPNQLMEYSISSANLVLTKCF